MVAAALCIPCMTATVALAGPAAPVVLGASALGAAGYYSLKKSKKKKRKKSKNKRKKNKSKQKGGSFKKNNKNNSKKCCICHYVKKNKTIRRVKGSNPQCPYHSEYCCKDKKNIIKSKN